jgi:hypothetical protein
MAKFGEGRVFVGMAVSVFVGAAVGLLLLWLGELVPSQVTPKEQPPRNQTNIGDRELTAFVRAYVEYHKIRREYEPALKNAQDPKKSQQLQEEANLKLRKLLDREGLTPERYNRIFSAVNADERLRDRVLKMVEEQRKRS